jgi:cytochrome c peroxidase
MIIKRLLPFLYVIAFAILATASCTRSTSVPSGNVAVDPSKLQLFKPLPETIVSETNPITDQKIALGRMLYYENRLSRSQQISCNSCHMLDKYGVDSQPTSDGHKGQMGDRNSPSVYNAAGHFVQFWDGRAADVEAQAKGPVLNPVEMAMPDEKAVVAVLKSMPEYVGAFQQAFPGEADPVN